MIRSPEHQKLVDDVAAAELALRSARIDLQAAKQRLRAYRFVNLRKLKPAKPKLEDLILSELAVDRKQRPSQIAQRIGYTRQAVRRGLMTLVSQKRARRLGKPGQHTFYMGVAS